MPKLRIKCYSRSQGLNSCLLAESAYFISTVAQMGHAFSWHEKSPNWVHIITKMAYTFYAEKHLPCGALYRIFNTYITSKRVVLFCHHTKHIMPSQIWFKQCTSKDPKKINSKQYSIQKMKKDQCCCSLCRCTDHPIIKIPHARTS